MNNLTKYYSEQSSMKPAIDRQKVELAMRKDELFTLDDMFVLVVWQKNGETFSFPIYVCIFNFDDKFIGINYIIIIIILWCHRHGYP